MIPKTQRNRREIDARLIRFMPDGFCGLSEARAKTKKAADTKRLARFVCLKDTLTALNFRRRKIAIALALRARAVVTSAVIEGRQARSVYCDLKRIVDSPFSPVSHLKRVARWIDCCLKRTTLFPRTDNHRTSSVRGIGEPPDPITGNPTDNLPLFRSGGQFRFKERGSWTRSNLLAALHTAR